MKKLWKWPRRRRESLFSAHDAPAARIALADLEYALASVEPAARLVLPRVLRRVVRRHNSLPGFGFRVPHSKTYVISREALLEIADRSEIGFAPTDILPERVILLECPSSEVLEERSRAEILLYYWELLFHARVHEEFHRLADDQRFGAADAAQRLTSLGSLESDEIRMVLRQERFLLPPYDDTSIYIEFAAVYLNIRYFQCGLMASFFPALEDLEKADAIVALDVHAADILEATRLPGTPEPDELREAARIAAEAFDADPRGVHSDRATGQPPRERIARWARGRQRSEKYYLAWTQRAARQDACGNLAGAAIRLARAEFWAPRERATEAANALRDAIHKFVDRLQAALDIGKGASHLLCDAPEGPFRQKVTGTFSEPRPWRESLLALAHQTPRGLWTVEARLLYDLQKACVDQSRTTSTIDVMHWVLSLGRRPIRRELPNQRLVLVSRDLRSAQKRLAAARISERQRRQLAEVLDEATKTAEDQLREIFRPKIVATLDEVGLLPQNVVEVVSRKKLVEELLDRIVERGFLTLGEVRDAVSRNHLKLPDCAGPRDFFHGDAVLRLNRRLTETLDGDYEHGDFYQRWIERFSFVAFGTSVGRWLTKYVAMPFGGAYAALRGIDHFVELAGFKSHLGPRNEDFKNLVTGQIHTRFIPMILLGFFLVLVINVPRFRGIVWRGLKIVGRAIKWLFTDSLQELLALPWIGWIVRSSVARIAINFVIKPLVLTLLFAALVPTEAILWERIAGLTAMYLSLIVIINSRAGRNVEEMAIDTAGEGLQRFGARPIVGLFWFIVDMFQRLMHLIERLLYAVDEWLRFRSGQSRAIFLLKAALGVGWFFVAYFIRFCVNLLIEPQLNPLKHIPWVTVSHKVIAPLLLASPLSGILEAQLGTAVGATLFTAITLGIPGIFGYLIWELKENWRLFAANRSKTLDAVLVGSHGESATRLLRPGIHSGTVPKRFAKLRRAARKSLAAGSDSRAVGKHREALHHVEICVRQYVEREFIAWFGESGGWPPPAPHVEEIHLSTTAIRVEVLLPGAVDGPLVMIFRLIDGELHLELSAKICSEALSEPAHHILRAAIVGVLKTGGVDLLNAASDHSAAAGEAPQEIGSLDMPWPEWVATWQSDRPAPTDPAWERVRMI